MARSNVFEPTRPVASVGYIRIRDYILIDAALKSKLEAAWVVTLVAREIEHAPGIDLKLPGQFITILADHYDAKGRTIDVSGADAASGPGGTTGAIGLAGSNTSRPGGHGTQGTAGASAANAGSIRIVVQRLGDVRLVAMGGAGGKGGSGGRGGAGRAYTQRVDGYGGSIGGDGGAGGNGGAGGKGGHIDVEFTAAGGPASPLMQVDGGIRVPPAAAALAVFRVNRGREGNRAMNYALHMIAVTQARGIGPGRAYLDKQTARGKDRVAGFRLLRRRLCDVVFTKLRADETTQPGRHEKHRLVELRAAA